MSHERLYPRITVSNSHGNTKYGDTVTISKNLIERLMTPRWPLTPLLLRSHVWLYARNIVSKSHENTSEYVFFQKLWLKGQWPKWPLDDLQHETIVSALTPLLLRSHVWLYPRIIVSNYHKHTSKQVDTVTLFSKTLTKGRWPLDNIWPTSV